MSPACWREVESTSCWREMGASCHSPEPLTSRAAQSLEPETLFQNQLFLQSALFLPLLHPSRHPAPTDGAGETTVPTAPAPSSAARVPSRAGRLLGPA